MRTPVVLLTGVDRDAMAATMVGLQFDLPAAVAVRHHIDVERGVLERVVSDVTGVVERVDHELEHACVTCAIREDVVPTLERLARSGRWSTIVAHLPVGAEAAQVCQVVSWDTRLARHLRVSGVVVAVDGQRVVDDLVGDDLLAERGDHSAVDDRRGVAEVNGAMVEYADVVVTRGEPDPTGEALLRALARPDADVVAGVEHLEAAGLTRDRHQHGRSRAWVDAVRRDPLPPLASDRVWRVELASPQPFHPERLLEDLESLGGGRHRSRGSFWLPTRPGQVLVWDGAGGQLSIGAGEPWRDREPHTRIVLTGVGAEPAHLRDAFAAMLLGPDEAAAGGGWRVAEDGFEPWLGPVRRVA
ncbi:MULTISPECIES: CobW family GTP-binding protein [unclassified Nocardioides]|uniref:CobW family GTP-binding protein n=1 Tax=unclassified Nocardioides TaxID=2615069 RepID=UPI0030150AA6